MAPIERCRRCVLPRSSGSVRFDASGTCCLCVQADTERLATGAARNPTEELEGRVAEVRQAGAGRRFDCIVGVSGGRDSTYLLHQLVRRHGLRCLAAYHRTPFTPDVIDANVRRATAALGVPLVEMHLSRERHRDVASAMTRLWLEKPRPILASLACASCKQHNHEILRIAKENGVRYLVMGSNQHEVFQLGAGQFRGANASARHFSVRMQLARLALMVKRGSRELAQTPELFRHLPVALMAVACLSPDAPYLRLRFRGVETLNYFYYARWTEAECEAALAELRWQRPASCNSSWRADCAFAEIKNLMFRRTTGVTYLDAFFSNMVRAGVMTREEALRRVELEGRVSEGRLLEACEALRIPRSCFGWAETGPDPALSRAS